MFFALRSLAKAIHCQGSNCRFTGIKFNSFKREFKAVEAAVSFLQDYSSEKCFNDNLWKQKLIGFTEAGERLRKFNERLS